jgi:hypothetical protein
MSEQLPAPEFDRGNYARPNQNWTCGYAAEGRSCPLGPDRKGRCQATSECQPALEIKPGETKGRWRCMRAGETCETGPLPDGSCCRPIPRCSPVPSLRRQRGRLTLAVAAGSMAFLLIVLGSPTLRNRFINPGAVSRSHSGSAFATLAAANRLDLNCGACHPAGASGPEGILRESLEADPGPFEIVKLITAAPGEGTVIDSRCEKCHTGHAFHQPMVVTISCTYCHQEHQGDKITEIGDAACNLCHGEAKIMTVAATAGAHLPAGAFRLSTVRRQLAFDPPRPAGGYTLVIHHFASDHPQFRFLADHWRDPDTLRFNHALHLAGATMPALPNGRKLNCAFCHQADAAGAYMTAVKFENNCRVCHSLQFDAETPGLQLPHGQPKTVAAFLHSLPQQYADYAARNGLAESAAQTQFVQAKLAHLRMEFGSGEALSRRVFFSTAKSGPAVQIGTLSGPTRPVFPGCAVCHDVKTSADNEVQVTPPVIYERWQIHAEFNHAKHTGLACEKCHDAIHSQDTADVLLPARETCLECHSPRGGVADSCATCHGYHKLVASNVN